MNCFPCFNKTEKTDDEKVEDQDINDVPVAQPKYNRLSTPLPREHQSYDPNAVDSATIEAKNFTFRELATATKNFRRECLLGEFGFIHIYKGTLQPSGEIVYVKRLDKNSLHEGNKEFLVEVLMLSLLHHSNLLELIGYCADGDQRLLVYEYLPMGSVEAHLLDLEPEKKPLDWVTRMKIACGIAEGLEHLHEKAKPPIIYRDLKCSNILLDDKFNPKLSDHGLAKLGGNNNNNKAHATVTGESGYHAPEYEKFGELTLKSDVYNFGVVLLELITGRRAVDPSKPPDEQNLVKWAQPFFRDPKRFPEMADPRLSGAFPVKGLNQAVGIAAMCIQDEPDVRPLIGDVVASLSFLSMAPPEEPVKASPPEIKSPKEEEPEMECPKEEEPKMECPKEEGHVAAIPPEIKAPSRKESRGEKTDDSDESSESCWSDSDESMNENQYEEKYDCMDDENGGSDHESNYSLMSSSSDDEEKEEEQQEKEISISSFGHRVSVEFDVASISSSSSSNSDNESRLPSTKKMDTKKSKSQHVAKSLKWKCRSTKSTKIPQEEGHEVSQNGSPRLSSKGRNGDEDEKNPVVRVTSKGRNGDGDEKNLVARVSSKGVNPPRYKKHQSTRVSSKGGNGHGYKKNQSARVSSKSTNGLVYEKKRSDHLSSKGENGHEYEKKQSARVSSKGENGHEYEKKESTRVSSKGENGHEYEKKQSTRISSKSTKGHDYEKKQSDRLSSKGRNGDEYSNSRQSSIAGSNDGSVRSGHHSDSEESDEESLV